MATAGRHEAELLYEDKKCRLEKDSRQYIITNKIATTKGIYTTYITDKNNVLWELCDCRKFFDRNSEEARTISKLLK